MYKYKNNITKILLIILTFIIILTLICGIVVKYLINKEILSLDTNNYSKSSYDTYHEEININTLYDNLIKYLNESDNKYLSLIESKNNDYIEIKFNYKDYQELSLYLNITNYKINIFKDTSNKKTNIISSIDINNLNKNDSLPKIIIEEVMNYFYNNTSLKGDGANIGEDVDILLDDNLNIVIK